MSEIYRSDAVRKLRDPQQLDTAIRLTSPSAWLALLALALIVAAFVAWSLLGTLPFRVEGLGVILKRDSRIFELAAPAGGRVEAILVKVGDRVSKGQPLVRLQNPEVRQRLHAAESLLANLQTQRRSRNAATDQEIAARKKVSDAAIAAYQRKIDELTDRIVYLEQKSRGEQQDLQRGLITRDTYELTVESLRTARQEIRSQQVAISQSRTEQLEYVGSGRREIAELDQQILEAQNDRDDLATQIRIEHAVNSPADGEVTEVSAKVEDAVDQGKRLVTIAAAGEGLQMYAYLPVSRGKRVEPGMAARVSPTTIERDIYGAISASVVSVSPLPASEAELLERFGNDELVEQMLDGGAPIEILIDLKTDPNTISGLDWSSSNGPPVSITPGTTALATVTVQTVRPIDLFIPIAKTWVTGR